jgi:GT2 family glycosyltransferase
MLQQSEVFQKSSEERIRLYVVLPAYGNWGDTLNCVRNLSGQSDMDFGILLADDGSPEPPPVELLENPFVRYMRFPHRGFAGNCNAGAAEAIRLGATHLLFLNSDTSFSCEYIRGWFQAILDRPASILSAMIYFYDAPQKVWYSGGKKTVLTPFFRITKQYNKPTLVDVASGCAMTVPTEAWHKLNGFDEQYVTYFEDLDLSLRARSQEIPVCVVADARLTTLHKVSQSFVGTGTWRKEYRMLSSSLRFIRIHYRGPARFFCLCMRALQLAATLLRQLPDVPSIKQLKNCLTEGMNH